MPTMPQQPDADFIALQTALAGEYSLDRELGRGGMGIVYLAREVRLARPVAIKVLPRELAARPDLRESFLRESQTVARLTHPNIVPLYAAGERGGFVYIAMAYVEGMTLGERIRTRGPLLPGQAARVLREVAWALAYAHGAHIVHRDVSAENIMLERGTERAIVMDFGIASAMQTAALDATGQVMGNAHYVSPEQAAGEPVDARSDLYSLGVVGFYALTGRLPFDAETSAEVVALHLNTAAPSITSIAEAVPPRLAAAVERCLQKDAGRRYRSAETFAEAIDLAFEHAKEIPAPLRSWINQGERELPARVAMLGVGTTTGITLAFAFGTPAFFFVPFVILGGLSMIPPIMRLRRALSDGYHVDDLHAALREHQLVRAEELEYERRQVSPRVQKALRLLFVASSAATAVGIYLGYEIYNLPRNLTVADIDGITTVGVLTLFFSLTGLTISGVPLIGQFIRHRLASRLASASIAFWKGSWGKRIAKIAGLGLKPVERPMLGMPVLTEIALGRATDHLFNALSKTAKRELAALPETVRRLEGDATRLRESINALDDQLAAFERGGDALQDASRSALAGELAAARALAAERLAATVSALESIRLDLLRLQMGSAPIESVTATLDAARQIGDRIGESIAAHIEVDRLLMEAHAEENDADDDDADTPVHGVPAAHS
ncbi:MAG: putative serine/threonine protein kinase [Gemmatimonadetes bacterium]|nr:putative serine/threonine protein kinase [Gemmatimonadota bacterium]